MSRASLEKKLREKGASQAEARYAAEWLEAIGAIDDAGYAALLVPPYYGQMGYGPARVAGEAAGKGRPPELWEDALDQATRQRGPDRPVSRRKAPGPGSGGGGEAPASPAPCGGLRLGRGEGSLEPPGGGDPRGLTPPARQKSNHGGNIPCHTKSLLSPWAAPRTR